MAKKKSSRSASPAKGSNNKDASQGGKPLGTLATRLTLETVRIIETHSKLNLVTGELPPELKVQLQTRLGTNPGTQVVLADVIVTLASPAPPEGDEKPLSSVVITIVAQCVFNIESAPDATTIPPEEAVEVTGMATFIAWPYVRHHAQMLTSSMGVPPFTLPLMRLNVVPTATPPEK